MLKKKINKKRTERRRKKKKRKESIPTSYSHLPFLDEWLGGPSARVYVCLCLGCPCYLDNCVEFIHSPPVKGRCVICIWGLKFTVRQLVEDLQNSPPTQPREKLRSHTHTHTHTFYLLYFGFIDIGDAYCFSLEFLKPCQLGLEYAWGGWNSHQKGCLKYDTKLHLRVRLKLWKSEECGVIFSLPLFPKSTLTRNVSIY